jgi:plasmid stabilization system protein ParE
MAADFIITAEAHQDITEAYDWYEDRRPGLGEDFLGAVDACFQRIRRRPELVPIAYETYRRAIIRRFPYTVIYEATAETIVVYSVFHSSRDPEKWRQRLP